MIDLQTKRRIDRQNPCKIMNYKFLNTKRRIRADL